ncbi:3-dehydroquinate synthase [Zongyangia hominis]|uniref:3-dehydroquinate synthase n=1 Tax=Zongyangia hominis TaxID=2763677 RepID=A0A926EDN3_9FIRM|nr:3-dehydroquinate synthase [Zongyangia hominis]MBC8571148.1 3-dehydroquinate synthase [Zongyangia hominis]
MKKIHVSASRGYDILIGRNLLTDAGYYLKQVLSPKRVCVVSDDVVFPLYGENVVSSLEGAGFSVVTFVFPHGEPQKNLSTVSELFDFLVKEGFTRTDVLVALGGGVVGDLTGFAAACYLRGVKFVQIPTTFLAQIDSSVGGKTGVDIPGGKNLVGAFWQPSLVLCDIATLSTLSPDIFADGTAEAIKYGLIYDADLFDVFRNHLLEEHLFDVVYRCIEIKKQVVEEDEFDTGLRMILNFGHTLGHAIEKSYHFTGITHGRAVAVGMVLISDACAKNGLLSISDAEAIRSTIQSHGLPVSVPLETGSLCALCGSDKKMDGDTLNLIILEDIGHAAVRKMSLAGLQEFMGNEG